MTANKGFGRVMTGVTALLLAGVLTCCGGSDFMNPPDKPGTAEQLVGTRWQLKDATLEFKANGILTLQEPDGQPLQGTYTVNEGILVGAFGMLPPLNATWDGKKLKVKDLGTLKRID